jgi:hypothetical protein
MLSNIDTIKKFFLAIIFKTVSADTFQKGFEIRNVLILVDRIQNFVQKNLCNKL